jgi:hypothetical protein
MANQKLIGQTFSIPTNTIGLLKGSLASFEQNNGNKGLKGNTLLKNLISSGNLTYENLKNIKNDFDNNGFPNEILSLKGVSELRKDIENALKLGRGQVTMNKDLKAKTGIANSHIKTHDKDNTKNPQVATGVERNPLGISETFKRKTLILTEEQVSKYIKKIKKEYLR